MRVMSSAITANANKNSDLPVQAKRVNRRFVNAINIPAKTRFLLFLSS